MPPLEAIGTILGTAIIVVFGFIMQDKRMNRSEADAAATAKETAQKTATQVAEQKHEESITHWEQRALRQFDSFQAQIDDFRQREAALNERLTAKYNAMTALEHRVTELEGEREAAEQKVSDLEKAAEERAAIYNQRIAELEGELHTLRQRVDELVKENERLQAERDRGQARELELQTRVSNQEREIADLQRRIVVLEAEKGVLEKLIDKLEVVRVKVNDDAPTEATAGAAPDTPTAKAPISESKGEQDS